MLATDISFWDDYTDPLKVTFDGPNRLIYLNPQYTSFSVKVDLYSASKRWLQRRDNTKFLPPIRVVGGDPVGGGLFAGDLYFLFNGWQVVVNHTVSMDGVLYQDDPLLKTYIVGPGGGVTATVSNLAYAYSTTGSVTPTAEPDWTDEEKRQIRFRLGLDGARTQPTTTEGTLPNVPGQVWDEIAVNHMAPGSAGAALNMSLANSESIMITTVSTMDMVQNVWRYSRNRTKIDTVTKQLIIYDTDGVTPIQIYNLRDRNGQPSVVESMERIPTM